MGKACRPGWPWILALLLLALPCWAEHPLAPESDWRQRHREAQRAAQPGEQVALISAGFLGRPYLPSPLIGSSTRDEVLVTDLARIDCFTLLDFVEALRRAPDLKVFDRHLLAVRYRGGELSYQARNHFFSDWGANNRPWLRDVTVEIAGDRAVSLAKTLNRKADGGLWLEGLPARPLVLRYLPTDALDEATLAQLQTGDYVGIVSPLPGLDVSHTGLLIRRDGLLYLRHASSRPETAQVLDQPLLPYLQGKPGLLVLRPQ
jgi:Protein of unknown function (DUF1460)